jgi:outer membrane protein
VTRFCLVAAILFATAGTAAAEPKTISLDDAIKMATEDTLQVDDAKDQIAAAKEHEKSTKTLRLPTLSITGGVQLWNKAIVIDFAPGASITARDQITGSVDVTIAQPITGATLLGRYLDIDRASIDAAEAHLDSTKVETAYQVAQTYLGALQAQTLHELATTGVTQLEADLVKVKALRDAHVLADLDVLRLEAARDAAQQQVLDAEVSDETARDSLAIMLALPAGTDLTLEPVDTTPPEIGWTQDEALAAARKQRSEYREADARQVQADVGVDVAKSKYLPDVNAIARYEHAEGQGAFAIKDSAFVGLQLSWNIWDWGKKGDDLREAKVAQRRAKRAKRMMDDGITIDVKSKWKTATNKRKSLDVSQSALKAAEEAYRLQQVKIQAGVATTTDVIDAESEVARARSQATISQYQYLTAWMALVRAVGQVPDMGAK